jgi:Domain of unknown function (DUF4783)
MKNLFFVLLFAPFFALANTPADLGNPGLDAISKAISSGDADALSKYFAENLEISIMDKEASYTKTQATEVVRTFFGSNKPKGFSPVHNGTSRESSDQYCIGNMASANGNYRVYIYLKTTGGAVSIKELRFDKE